MKKPAKPAPAQASRSHTPAPPPVVTPPAPDAWKRPFYISLIAVFVLMTGMSFWFGISGDEVVMNNYGEAILHYYTTFGEDTRAIAPPKEMDKDGVVQLYGGFFDLAAAVVNKVSPLPVYTTRHVLNAWAGFLAILFASLICVRLGGRRLGVICIWLMFLSPFFLGHAMNNPKDIPFAAAYIAAIYYFLRFYDKLPAVTWKDYIPPVIAMALAIDIRVAGILVIPYMFVYFVLDYLFRKKARKPAGTVFKSFLIIAVLGYLGASLLWPYALQNPISNPLTALSELSAFKMNLNQLYEGRKVFSGELPPSYLVKNFFITNTYVLLAGLALFVPVLWRRRASADFPDGLFIAFITIFPLAYIIYKHANVYHAWRHVLFIFPGAAVMAAYGWEGLLLWAKKPSARYAAMGLLAVGLLLPAGFIVKTFPNTVTYYNGFVGGVKGAYGNYEMDYYYNSVKEAADWFIKHELPKTGKGDTVRLASNASSIVAVYMKDHPEVQVNYVRYYERSMQPWDYAIFHIALIPEGRLVSRSWVIPQTLHVAGVEGLPLCILVKRPSADDYHGFTLLNEGKVAEAIPLLQQYHKADPDNEIVNMVLVRYYLSMNRADSAGMLAERILAIDPNNVEAAVTKGQMLLAAGRAEEALRIFDDLIARYPDYIQLHYYKGQAHRSMGQLDAALSSYNIAMAVPEVRAACIRAMAEIFMQQGRTEEAQRLLRMQ